MSKTSLIFKHEYFSTIKRKGFLVLTFSLPVLALLAIGVFRVTSGIDQPAAEAVRIGYVDETGSFNQFTSSQEGTVFVPFDNSQAAVLALTKEDIAEYFVIPQNYITTGLIERYTMQREAAPPSAVSGAIKNFISSNLLAGEVPESVIARIQAPPNLVTVILTPTGEVAAKQGGLVGLIVPGVFTFLLAFSLTFSSAYVLQGLGEEKESRLMEILLSSVSTKQLIAGKVLGIGAAGLTQVMVWAVSIPLLMKLASSSLGGFLGLLQLSPGFLALGVAYFILGYALFAVLSASVAAISPTVREAQGLGGVFTIFTMIPFWFYSLLLLFPNNPVWVVLSVFPFSAPTLVMLRFSMTGIPAWQLVLSLVVMAFSVIGGLLLAAKLLRTYLLMYGKRPTLREIIRNLRG